MRVSGAVTGAPARMARPRRTLPPKNTCTLASARPKRRRQTLDSVQLKWSTTSLPSPFFPLVPPPFAATMAARASESPSSPPLEPSARPQMHRRSSSAAALTSFSVPFQRYVRDDISDWASGFTLLGTSDSGRFDFETRSWRVDRYDGDVLRLPA